MFRKFYCPTCNEFKSRSQVAYCHYFGYYCKHCNKKAESTKDMLLRLNRELKQINHTSQLSDLHDWIRREAVERYKGHPAEKKAFKEGIYTLLDKIGFDYKGERT